MFKRLRSLFYGPTLGDQIDREIQFHLAAEIEHRQKNGMSAGEARRTALRDFGGVEKTREAVRDARGMTFWDVLRQDVRFGLRSLRRSPSYTIAAVTILALGIGANTAVFSVVSRELIDPLPYRASDRLVLLYSPSARASRGFVSPNEIARLQSSASFASVAAFGSYSGYTYVGDQETLSWEGVSVGPNFFRTLGVDPLLGRLIDDRDVEPGAPKVAVIGDDIWRSVFGGDPGVVGRTIRMNDAEWTVIGVTRPDFAPPARAPQVWTPLDVRPILATRAADAYIFQAVARLADGATLTQVQSEVDVIGRHSAATDAMNALRLSLIAVPIRDAMVGGVRPMLLVVMGAALLVLALACVNVAGLFLSRATSRGREIAVRAALGAGRRRIVRQLVTETTILGIAGGGLGVLFAYWGRSVLLRVGEHVLPHTGAPPAIDAGVLGFALLVSVFTGVLSGLVPALFATRVDLHRTLADGSRASSDGRVRTRAGRVLVAGQMALALLLLVGAGLLGRTLFALQHQDMGYDASGHVLSVTVSLPRSYAAPDAQVQFFTEWLVQLRSLPGVDAAGLIGIAPWNGWNHYTVQVEHGQDGATVSTDATLGSVSDGYFAAVGTRVVAGRAFATSDRGGSLPVAIVSDRLARLAWPGKSAIGQRLRVADVDTGWRTVVGVVSDVRGSASSEFETSIYVPAWQSPQRWYEVLVRSGGDAGGLLPGVRQALRAMDPTLPVLGPRTLDQMLSVSLSAERLPVIFTAAFALLALVLAVLGIYGIVAYAVTLRTRELGIRVALGGSRGNIVRLVLRDGLITAAAGIALGLGAAVAGARLIAGLLYGVTTHDPATFAAAALVLLAASAAACLIPARRATRINPVDALRSD